MQIDTLHMKHVTINGAQTDMNDKKKNNKIK